MAPQDFSSIARRVAARYLSPELDVDEAAIYLWDHHFEKPYNALLEKWADRYAGIFEGYPALQAKVNLWFFEREPERAGNLRDTPLGEMPDFNGIQRALFHRIRKMTNDLAADIRESLGDTDDAKLLTDAVYGMNQDGVMYRELHNFINKLKQSVHER